MNIRLPVLLITLLVSSFAYAQEADPPGRVARVSYIRGEVSLQTAENASPEKAVINQPVTIDDRLLTSRDSRAELSLGVAAIRLDADTDVSVANLDEDIAQIELNSGVVTIRLREVQTGDTFQVDTPNATVQLTRTGDYRIEALPSGTRVAVRRGDAEVSAGGDVIRVPDDREVHLANGEQLANVRPLEGRDSFDDWSADREAQLTDSESSRYVSRQVVGYEDLDRYGSWRSEPEFGMVWYPSAVTVGWAPYRYGNWAWVSPWGWTWVDHSPWGFAPFHYGRWAYVRTSWCWVPGPRHHRPIYAPALVAWGGGVHVGASFGGRPSHWIPLGPREVYVPWHRTSPRYLRNVNISNTAVNNTYITNVYRGRVRDVNYRNRGAPGAYNTELPGVAPGRSFVRPHPVTRSAAVIDEGAAPGRRIGVPGNRFDNDGDRRDWRTSGEGRDGRPGPNGANGVGDNGARDNSWRTGRAERNDRADRTRREVDGAPSGYSGGDRRDGRGAEVGNNSGYIGSGARVERPRTIEGRTYGDGRVTLPRQPTERRSVESYRQPSTSTPRYERRDNPPPVVPRSSTSVPAPRPRSDPPPQQSRPVMPPRTSPSGNTARGDRGFSSPHARPN